MNKLQASRMLTLANFLKTQIGKPEGPEYKQHHFFSDSPAVVDQMICGTSACALGWTALIFPQSWTTGQHRGHHLPILKKNIEDNVKFDIDEYDPYDNASEFFGINCEEARTLFGSGFRSVEKEVELLEETVDRYGYTYAN